MDRRRNVSSVYHELTILTQLFIQRTCYTTLVRHHQRPSSVRPSSVLHAKSYKPTDRRIGAGCPNFRIQNEKLTVKERVREKGQPNDNTYLGEHRASEQRHSPCLSPPSLAMPSRDHPQSTGRMHELSVPLVADDTSYIRHTHTHTLSRQMPWEFGQSAWSV